MTDNNLITRIGRALWGERWQAEMARTLGVNKDTVQAWRRGQHQPRPGVYRDLLNIAEVRQIECATAIREIRQAAENE